MKNIFITGGTGFLGWDLVKDLLDDKDLKLYLLVRDNAKEKASERVEKLVNNSYKGNQKKDVLERIEVISGDITKDGLGINKVDLEKLTREIDSLYHCAALCEFGVELKRIRTINVTGTKNVLDFAMKCKENGRFASFHHLSTVAVIGDFSGTFYEESLDVGQRFNNTYEETKFEAEKLIRDYRNKGMNISVYRPSIITGDSRTGEVSNFQMFYQPLHIFSLEIFDEVPANKGLKYNLVPVDYVAKAIYLISSNKDNNKNYHLSNPSSISLDSLLDIASSYFGFKKPQVISEKEFDFKTLDGFRKKVIDSYIPYFIHKKVVFDTKNFDSAVNGKDFSWPVIEEDLLTRLFKYCADTKYIKRNRKEVKI